MKNIYEKGLTDEQDNLFSQFVNTNQLWWDHRWYIFHRLDLEEKMTEHVDKLNKLNQQVNEESEKN